jgi:protein TonB
MLNNSSDLYKTEWLNLVFKNRNQHYGAYVLRSESSATMLKSLCIAVPIFVLLFCGPMIYRFLKPENNIVHNQPTGFVIDLPLPLPPKIEEKREEMPKAEPPKEKVKMVKMPSNIRVVEQPAIDQPPPTIDELKDAVVGPVTQDGVSTDLQVTPSSSKSTGNGEGIAPSEDNGVYDAMGIEAFPEFEGGMKAWAKYLQRNLRYPYEAQEKGIGGKVFVSFIIEKDGSVSNVKLIKGLGAGCDEEALRVIGKSPKWKPGRQNAQNVRVRYNIPIYFSIQQ